MITDYDLTRFRYHTGRTIEFILEIESLPDDQLLEDLRYRFPSDTNPRWIASQQIRVLYQRDLLGDREYDLLSDRVDYTDHWEILMLAALLRRKA